ncbi:YchE family NAAT transporter [Methyloglobulus sp.]|jgi:multiple antibiotic resistance protein|uniref:YchE family NAAT transporter n=1 Tax=Methyloglobulus sp. TaxID=2518622 RepID=UPI0032B78690
MLEYTDYLKIFIALLAVVDPLIAMPVIVSMTARDNASELKVIARTVVLTVITVLLLALYFGQEVLIFFGISINSFRVSGGILLMLMSLSMLQGKISETVRNKEEAKEEDKQNAVVPLSIPLLAGPGAISTIILYAQKGSGIHHYLMISVDIFAVAAILWCVLRATPWLTQHLSQTGINVVIRLMGLILLALSVEFIAGGLKGLFPALA